MDVTEKATGLHIIYGDERSMQHVVVNEDLSGTASCREGMRNK